MHREPGQTDSRMLLQRKLPHGDCAKWRTVIRFSMAQADSVQRLLSHACGIDSDVAWRVTTHDGRPLA